MAKDRKALQRVIKTVQSVTGTQLSIISLCVYMHSSGALYLQI